MDRLDVLMEFCSMATDVMAIAFKYKVSADCFCVESKGNFCFDKEVINYIKEAIYEKLNKDYP